ncbi:MAG: methyltransferase domain-containing protein [Deltaproteobacteria bacterium]|nr:methyltransferase domain-containing protein [Deltaproteobacteria bacterium]
MPVSPGSYLMENLDESLRLELKTDPEAVRRQAAWCGLAPGQRVLDAGCGPGKITSILHEMIQPGGEILGVDYSEERIRYAGRNYARGEGIAFRLYDLRKPIEGVGLFDLIWVRFVLEYNRRESQEIIRNLAEVLRPGGILCLLDLDHNSLSHHELPETMEAVLFHLMKRLEEEHNFDPYSGRKLYAHLYDLGYEDIRVDLLAHHLIYGEVRGQDVFNWITKVEVVSRRTESLFQGYPGGRDAFFEDFKSFFLSPRRFTYTPLILCRGKKPAGAPACS